MFGSVIFETPCVNVWADFVMRLPETAERGVSEPTSRRVALWGAAVALETNSGKQTKQLNSDDREG